MRPATASGADLYPPETERDLIAELRRNPSGPHSPGLQRLLNIVRADPASHGLVLVTLVPFRQWVIASMPEDRSERIVIEREPVFTDLEAAEWALFRRRWFRRTGAWPD
jgi:hypothetical protein